jgi:small subunit ribosomal protein S4
MSKYTGPRLRLVRKFNQLPGLTRKQPAATKQKQTPGQHAKPQTAVLRKSSAYGLRLLEKQKLRFNYNINERQFVRYVKEAKRQNGPTGEILLALLEMRLDNTVYRLGFAPTISAARQLINHGHILVNQKKLTIPSYACQLKDVISVKQNKKSQALVKTFLPKRAFVPDHLSFNPETLTGVVNQKASRQTVRLKVNELLVVEYYSRN